MKNMQWVCLKVPISCAASTLQENKVGFGDTDNGTAPEVVHIEISGNQVTGAPQI